MIEYRLQGIFRERELKRIVTTTPQYENTELHFDCCSTMALICDKPMTVQCDAIYDVEKERQTVLQGDLIL